MGNPFKLQEQPVVGFVPTTNATRAKIFYRDTLGLTLVAEELPFALVFDANGTMLRVTIVKELPPAAYTVLGWRVQVIEEAVRALKQAGMVFERYSGLQQDELEIWTSPSGTKIAWFKD